MRSIASAAAGFVIFMAAPAAAATSFVAMTPIVAAADQGEGNNDGNNEGNHDGDHNNGGNNQGTGEGVTTPELPSGVLVAVGLVPLLAGAAILRRREWKAKLR